MAFTLLSTHLKSKMTSFLKRCILLASTLDVCSLICETLVEMHFKIGKKSVLSMKSSSFLNFHSIFTPRINPTLVHIPRAKTISERNHLIKKQISFGRVKKRGNLKSNLLFDQMKSFLYCLGSSVTNRSIHT